MAVTALLGSVLACATVSVPLAFAQPVISAPEATSRPESTVPAGDRPEVPAETARPNTAPAAAAEASVATPASAAQGQGAANSSAALPPAGLRFTRDELEPLLQRLEADGFSRETLNRVFYDRRLHRLDRVVTYNVLNPDSARIYEQFVTPFAIRLAKTFRRRHARELSGLESRFGVSPEVVVGILLVETQFGTAALQYRLLEVFTTLVVDATPLAVERHYRRMKADYPALDRAWVEERVAKKAGWAYEELKALLAIRDRLRVESLYEVKGSYAGAFGMPQFMPTSYVQWAVDGNNDRLVDLDNPADAMASIANFLVQHGWRADATLEQKMRAVWEYNRSTHYVRTIFAVALRMTRPARKRGGAPPEPNQAETAMPDMKPVEAVPTAETAPPQAATMPRPHDSPNPQVSGPAAPAPSLGEPNAAELTEIPTL